MIKNVKKRIKVISMGPYPPPLSGQALAFKYFVDSVNGSVFSFNRKFGQNKVIYSLQDLGKYLILLLRVIFDSGNLRIFISASRGRISVFRDILVCLFANLKKQNYYLHVQGNDLFSEVHSSVSKGLIKFIYRRSRGVIVLNEYMAESFKVKLDINPHIVSNPSSHMPSSICEISTRLYDFIYLGNIIYSKGVIQSIDAFIALERSDLSFVVAGDFKEDEYCSLQKIKKIFFEKIRGHKNIRFLGTLDSDTKFSYLEKSKFFVLPSFYKTEAAPLSIVEALSCGCVIITSDNNSINTYEGANFNFTVSTTIIDKTDEFTRILKKVVELDSDALKHISVKNYDNFKNNYTVDRYIERLREIVFADQ